MSLRRPCDEMDRANRGLLALLMTGERSHAGDGHRFDVGDWAQVQAMAEQHRLCPLLHYLWQSGGEQAGIPAAVIPAEVRALWADAFRTSALRALAAQATLMKVGSLLDQAGIPYAALKGAALAWHAYPHPALRPMRDIDILVPLARAGEAYAALVAQGFIPEPADKTPVIVALRDHKHLPGLFDPQGKTRVEVHSRLFEHVAAAQDASLLCRTDDLLGGRVWSDFGQVRIAFLPATETLLHLLVHSAYEHRFDNGPQILHDVAALLARDRVDWARFWCLAGEGGWTRGCQLLLGLTEQFCGAQPVEWGDPAPPDIPAEMLDHAALLMLQDTDLRQDLAVQLELAHAGRVSWSGSRRLLSRLLAPRHVLAAYAGVAPHRRWIWRHYPAWLVSRLTRTLSGRWSRQQQTQVSRAMALGNWLEAR